MHRSQAALPRAATTDLSIHSAVGAQVLVPLRAAMVHTMPGARPQASQSTSLAVGAAQDLVPGFQQDRVQSSVRRRHRPASHRIQGNVVSALVRQPSLPGSPTPPVVAGRNVGIRCHREYPFGQRVPEGVQAAWQLDDRIVSACWVRADWTTLGGCRPLQQR